MQPGYTQIQGAPQFGMDFETLVGSRNYIGDDAGQDIDFAYSTQENLLNQGRFSGEYFATQLYRMRDAYQRYAAPLTVQPPAKFDGGA